MKKIFLLLFTICTTLNAQQNVVLNIENLAEDSIYFVFSPLDGNRSDNMEILAYKNGECCYNLPDSGAYLVTIQPKTTTKFRKNGRPIFGRSCAISNIIVKGNSDIKIKAKIEGDNYLDYNIIGGESLADLSKHRREYKKLEILLDSINVSIELALSNDERNSLFPMRTEVNKQINEIQEMYVNKYINDPTTGNIGLVSRYLFMNPNLYFSRKNDLDQAILSNSEYAPALRILDEMMSAQEKAMKVKSISKGEVAPNFKLKKLNGESFELSELKGKYVILDFWGSWCPPCIKEMPKLKEYHEKYAGKVIFVGINCDDSDTTWRETIKKHGMNWLQVINDKENSVSAQYSIKTYPTKILIDENGVVINIYSNADNDLYNDLDKIF